jgi:PAS domain S-box-containing protein
METTAIDSTFFNVLISNIPQSLLVTDKHRKVLIANQQFCNMFGFKQSPAQLIGQSGIEVLAELSNQLDDFVNEAHKIDKLTDEKRSRFNDIMRMADGRILMRDYVPIKVQQQIVGNIWLFRDETEKMQAQEVIQHQKFFYEDILNNLPADIAVFSPDHRYLFLNPVAVKDEELRKWLIGKTDIDYCILRGKDMSIAEKRRNIFKTIVESKKEIEWEETIINRENQTEFHLRKMSPIYNEQGKLKLLIGYGVNISEIKKIQQMISVSEKRYRDLFNYSQAIICTHDMDGILLTVNPSLCEIIGVPVEKVVGRSLKEFMVAEDRDGFDELYISTLESNKKIRGLFRVVNSDGKKVYLLYQNYCVEEPGTAPYVIAFAQDVTDRIKVEKQLKEAKKLTEESARAKERFLANMSHEIRTPMNGILGITTLLQKTELDTEQHGLLKIIQDSAQNLLTIINDILDLEKIGAGEIQLEDIIFDLNAKLEMIVKFFQHSAKEKKLILQLDSEIPPNSFVSGDPTRFVQIMNNLVSNAIKFTHQGTVVVQASIQSETANQLTLHCIIKDTGIGIDEDKLVKIFNPFTQAYPETARKYGGTGLGLAITKNLIEVQSGSIWVESETNVGSAFHFVLTYKKAEAPLYVAPVKTNYQLVYHSLKNLKILVAEDNEVNQFLTKNVLNQLGCQITLVTNGELALNAVKENDYDLVLMDIQMPVMNGLKASEKIRALANPIKSQVPIIALTANALKGEEVKYAAVGINDFLIKPFKEQDLFEIINKTILNNNISFEKHNDDHNGHSSSSALYDLSQLQSAAKDNADFLKNLVKVFIDSTPPMVAEMIAALENEDKERLSQTAHKLKSSIDTLNIESIKKDIRTIEYESKEAQNLLQFEPLVGKIKHTISQVELELKKQFEL